MASRDCSQRYHCNQDMHSSSATCRKSGKTRYLFLTLSSRSHLRQFNHHPFTYLMFKWSNGNTKFCSSSHSWSTSKWKHSSLGWIASVDIRGTILRCVSSSAFIFSFDRLTHYVFSLRIREQDSFWHHDCVSFSYQHVAKNYSEKVTMRAAKSIKKLRSRHVR